MAAGGYRDRQGKFHVHLHAKPPEVAPGAATRRAVFAAHQPHQNDPALLWQYYIQLVAVEQAFKNLKGNLAIRPVFHQDERRIEPSLACSVPHIFIAFLAYWLQITLQRRLYALAPGLTARRAVEKFAAVQMIDVHLPTTG
jgi:hypothetical protein